VVLFIHSYKLSRALPRRSFLIDGVWIIRTARCLKTTPRHSDTWGPAYRHTYTHTPYKGGGALMEEGSYDDALRTRGNHMTFPSRRHAAPASFSNRPRHPTMSSSLETDYATVQVSYSLRSSSLSSNPCMEPEYPATLQEFASVPADHPGLTLTLPRIHPPHAHLRSGFLFLHVSPFH
jgi:hypothetical protein